MGIVPSTPFWRPDKLTVVARFLQFKLRLPVIIAVCASVPAVFLTIWSDGEMALAGKIIGWAAGIVLWAESVILLLAELGVIGVFVAGATYYMNEEWHVPILPLRDTVEAEAHPASRTVPTFMAHGTHDPLIPIERRLSASKTPRSI